MSTAANRGHYIPWIFVAGFAVVVAVNATMMWLAISSFAGLYTEKPRDRGIHYNDVLQEQQRRDSLGWRVEARWLNDAGRLEIDLFDEAGQPLTPDHLSVELVRPVEKRPPLPVTMAASGSGRFAAHIDLPERGNWDLDIVAERGGERFALTRRMFLR